MWCKYKCSVSVCFSWFADISFMFECDAVAAKCQHTHKYLIPRVFPRVHKLCMIFYIVSSKYSLIQGFLIYFELTFGIRFAIPLNVATSLPFLRIQWKNASPKLTETTVTQICKNAVLTKLISII